MSTEIRRPDWLDDIEAQADASSPYYLPRLIAEIRRLRGLSGEVSTGSKRLELWRDRTRAWLRAASSPFSLEQLASPPGQEDPLTPLQELCAEAADLRAAARGVVKEWESSADDDRYAIRLAVNISKLARPTQEPSSGLPPVDAQAEKVKR